MATSETLQHFYFVQIDLAHYWKKLSLDFAIFKTKRQQKGVLFRTLVRDWDLV